SSYARDASGEVYAWGDNLNGQLGVLSRTGVDNTYSGSPRKAIPVASGKKDIVYYNMFGGFCQAIYLDQNGMLWGCGSNTYDQLANGTTKDIYVPTLVGDSALQIVIAENYTASEGDEKLYMGDYVYHGTLTTYNQRYRPDENSPTGFTVENATWTAEELTGPNPPTNPITGNPWEEGQPKGLYVFDRTKKRSVPAGDLNLVQGKDYYLETDFDVFNLLATRRKLDFTYNYN
ncbi:MAG: hypothetical protein RSC08_07895, partial [Oscillospiraceae bacterium]